MKNRWLYSLSLCLIGLSELPVHGIAFGNMADTVIEQWIMALTVAVGVPVAGHFAGRSWKIGRRWIAIILTLIVVGQSILLGQVWELYLFEVGVSPAVAQTSALLMVVISILLYGVATVLSLARHDISPNMEEVV